MGALRLPAWSTGVQLRAQAREQCEPILPILRPRCGLVQVLQNFLRF